MDNLAIHRNGEIKQLMDHLGFHYAYTPVTSPQFNGVEEVISAGKRILKARRIDAILKGKTVNLEKMIEDSFKAVNPHVIAKAVRRSLQLLPLNN